jgi:hypothetical protein
MEPGSVTADAAPGDLGLVAALVRHPLLTALEAARLAGVALPELAAADGHDDYPEGRAAA